MRDHLIVKTCSGRLFLEGLGGHRGVPGSRESEDKVVQWAEAKADF
jgi:hypothetical protein